MANFFLMGHSQPALAHDISAWPYLRTRFGLRVERSSIGSVPAKPSTFGASGLDCVPRASTGHFDSGVIFDGHWVRAERFQPGHRPIKGDGAWPEVAAKPLAAEPLTAYNLSFKEFRTHWVVPNSKSWMGSGHNALRSGPRVGMEI